MYTVITMKPTRPSITHTKYLVKLPGPVLPILNGQTTRPSITYKPGPVSPSCLVNRPSITHSQTTRSSIKWSNYQAQYYSYWLFEVLNLYKFHNHTKQQIINNNHNNNNCQIFQIFLGFSFKYRPSFGRRIIIKCFITSGLVSSIDNSKLRKMWERITFSSFRANSCPMQFLIEEKQVIIFVNSNYICKLVLHT